MQFSPVAFIYKALQVLLAVSECDLLDSPDQRPHRCNKPRALLLTTRNSNLGDGRLEDSMQSLKMSFLTADCLAFACSRRWYERPGTFPRIIWTIEWDFDLLSLMWLLKCPYRLHILVNCWKHFIFTSLNTWNAARGSKMHCQSYACAIRW